MDPWDEVTEANRIAYNEGVEAGRGGDNGSSNPYDGHGGFARSWWWMGHAVGTVEKAQRETQVADVYAG